MQDHSYVIMKGRLQQNYVGNIFDLWKRDPILMLVLYVHLWKHLMLAHFPTALSTVDGLSTVCSPIDASSGGKSSFWELINLVLTRRYPCVVKKFLVWIED